MPAGLIDQTVPRVRCKNETHLMALLRKNGPLTGKLSEKPDFLYRGQTERSFRLWSSPTSGTIMLDSLHPTDHRAGNDTFAPIESVPKDFQVECSENLSYLRTILAHLILDRYVHAAVPNGIGDWMHALERKKNSNPADYIVALAQYCGFETRYTDMTSSSRVALWFATHTLSGDYLSRNLGYVYQIDLGKLERAERSVNKSRVRAAHDHSRHIDLRSTPESLTARPRAQHGWSLIHFEYEPLHLELIAQKGIVVYEFPRGPKPCQDNILSPQALGFIHEPLVDLFRRYTIKASTHLGLQDWVNHNINSALPRANHIDLSDRQWVRNLHHQAHTLQESIAIS